jgi:hypothetical protein
MPLRKKGKKGVFWSSFEQFSNQLIGFIKSIDSQKYSLSLQFVPKIVREAQSRSLIYLK